MIRTLDLIVPSSLSIYVFVMDPLLFTVTHHKPVFCMAQSTNQEMDLRVWFLFPGRAQGSHLYLRGILFFETSRINQT